MKQDKRAQKESLIIKSAEKIFIKMGFKNAKMEEIAAAAGITKVTLYSYFHSKENLYLAITYTGFQKLLDSYYKTIKKNKSKTGLIGSIGLLETSMQFFKENFLYSEALLEYFSIIRTSDQGQNKSKLTEAIKESIYFNKLQDLQNLPFKLSFQEIERGKLDGSIVSELDSMLIALQGWTMVTGFAKILAASGGSVKPLFTIDLMQLKNTNLDLARLLLTNKNLN
jgi:AcrR family transcriptional regulator